MSILPKSESINANHLRMARAGLDLTIRELADLANVNKATIVRIEAGAAVRQNTVDAVRTALERKGANFVLLDSTCYVHIIEEG